MSQIQAEQIGRSLSLFDMVDRILDKGLIIDAYVSVSIVGIELLVIRARLVVASLETYLRYASAMGVYGEPGGVLQKGASPKEMGSKKGELPKQQQDQQQQLQQLLQQLGQLGQPLQQQQQPTPIDPKKFRNFEIVGSN
jgi:gas vesicle structural protein